MKELIIYKKQVKYITLIDDEDFEYLSKFKWLIINTYAARFSNKNDPDYNYKKRKVIFLHRVVNKTPDGHETDHINGNKLDNRKENLRTVDRSKNQQNATMKRNNTSGYKGVWFSRYANKWSAGISINGKSIKLGYFDTKEEAAMAYDNAAKENYKEYAKLNFN